MLFQTTRLVLLFSMACFAALLGAEESQWEILGPGGGASITNVTCDPTTPNGYWVGTRSHGLYFTSNGGKDWSHRGRGLGNGVISEVCVEPNELKHSDPKHHPKRKKSKDESEELRVGRVYAGSAQGLFLSDTFGKSWSSVKALEGRPIGHVFVNPFNTDEVFAMEGWATLDDQIKDLLADKETIEGERVLWVSRDRGETLKETKYEKSKGYRRTYSFTQDPADPDTYFLGAHSGLYRSTNAGKSWKRLSDPKGAQSGQKAKTRESGCRGADISKDGKRIVAIFANDNGDYAPFLADTKKLKWKDLSEGLSMSSRGRGRRGGAKYEWAMPRFSYTALASECILIAQLSGRRRGLYQGTLSETKKGYEAKWERICQSPSGDDEDDDFKFPMGWTRRDFRVRDFDIAPDSWGSPMIAFSTTETILVGDPNSNGFPFETRSWQDITTKREGRREGKRSYANIGMHATEATDFARAGSYQILGTYNNGVLESFNNGKSWAEADSLDDSPYAVDALALVEDSYTTAIVAYRRTWGNNVGRVTLAMKVLLNKDDSDKWVEIGGGSSGIAGLESDRINKIVPHTYRKGPVALATKSHGVMFVDALGALKSQGEEKWVNITLGSPIAKSEIVDLEFDPLKPDTIWVLARGKKAGLWRGDLERKKWKWEQIHAVKNAESMSELGVWSNEGKATSIALTYAESAKTLPEIFLSHDEGETFTSVFATQAALDASEFEWAKEKSAGKGLQIESLEIASDEIIFSIGSALKSRGLGVFRLKLGGEKPLLGRWDGNDKDQLPNLRATRIVMEFGDKAAKAYLVLPGAGLARRVVDEFVPLPAKAEEEEEKK